MTSAFTGVAVFAVDWTEPQASSTGLEMHFVSLVLANILGRPARSLLTISGVAVAVGAVVSLVGIARGFQESLVELYDERGIDLIVLQAGKVQQTSSVLAEELGERIAGLPNVKAVAGTLADVVSMPGQDLVGVPLQGWPSDSILFDQLNVVQGRRFMSTDQKKILLGEGLAEILGKRSGDPVTLLGEEFQVVGVFKSFNVFENGSVVMPLKALQALMLREDEVTMYAVIAEDRSREALLELAAGITALEKGISANLTREFVESTGEMRMTRSVAWMTSTIALVIGSIGMLNTMLMAVFERTREIAMLRAIGWRKSHIISMILQESVLLSLAGAVVGALGAIGLTWGLSQLPASGRLVSGDVSLPVVGQGFAIALFVGLLGGLYPAVRAARLLPVEGLRHD